MKLLSLSLLLLLAATVSHGLPSVSVPKVIELLTSNNIFENEAELLENEKLSINYHNCRSWHLGVETSNIIDFHRVPANCKDYAEDYLTTSKQYQADSKTYSLLRAKYGFGTEKRPRGAYWKWLGSGEPNPGLPETLVLYNNLLELGIEPILLTERWTTSEEVTLENLKAAGFTYWKHLLFKPKGSNEKEVVYKSKARENLVRRGYNIIGNIGDQWADLVENTPGRVFKLPNPLYYVPS